MVEGGKVRLGGCEVVWFGGVAKLCERWVSRARLYELVFVVVVGIVSAWELISDSRVVYLSVIR